MWGISSFIEKFGVFLQSKNLDIPIDLENISKELIANEAILLIASIVSWVIAKAFSRWLRDAILRNNFFKNIFSKVWINVSVRSFADFIYSVFFVGITFAWLIVTLKYVNLEIEFLDAFIDNVVYVQLPKFWWIGLVILWAFLFASILKTVLIRVVRRFSLGDKLWINLDWAWVVWYWWVIVFFIPIFLKRIGNHDLLNPVNTKIDDISVYAPNIVESFIVIIVWFIIARFAQKMVDKFIVANWVEKISEKLKVRAEFVSKYAWWAVYVIILLVTTFVALNNLKIDTISGTIDKWIQSIIDFTNGVLNASIIVVISFVIWKIISNLITELLTKVNFDSVLEHIGLSKLNLKVSPSRIVWNTVFAYIVLFVFMKAFSIIGIDKVSWMFISIFWFLNKMLFLFLIFALGLYLSNLLDKKIRVLYKSEVLAIVAKIGVMLLTGLLLFLIY